MTLDWLAQLLGLPAGLHGHIEDTASTGDDRGARGGARGGPGAASSSAPSTRTPRSRRRPAARARGPRDAGRRRVPAARRTRSTSTDACAVVATIGTTSTSSVDPVPAIADACERAGAWLHVDAAYAGLGCGLPGAARALRRLGARRLDRRQPAQVAAHADGLLGALDAPARRVARGVQPRARVPARQRGGGEPERVQPGARPPLPRAQALGGAALLRPRGAAGADPRGVRLAALFEGWVRDEPGWELVAPRPFSLVCFRRDGSDEENEALLERVNATGEVFLSHTRLDGRYVLRLAVGNARTTEDDVRLAWDVLRREAATRVGEKPRAALERAPGRPRSARRRAGGSRRARRTRSRRSRPASRSPSAMPSTAAAVDERRLLVADAERDRGAAAERREREVERVDEPARLERVRRRRPERARAPAGELVQHRAAGPAREA